MDIISYQKVTFFPEYINLGVLMSIRSHLYVYMVRVNLMFSCETSKMCKLIEEIRQDETFLIAKPLNCQMYNFVIFSRSV